MIEFATMSDLALHLVHHDLPAIDREVERGLDRASRILQRAAKRMFGDYQQGIGPFHDWPELADATKEDRVAKGFTENDPLLRTGDLRDSIERESGPHEAIVGSTSPIMEWQEFGTAKIPPRPVLGIALYQNWPLLQQLMGDGVARAFVGDDRVHESLGYDLS